MFQFIAECLYDKHNPAAHHAISDASGVSLVTDGGDADVSGVVTGGGCVGHEDVSVVSSGGGCVGRDVVTVVSAVGCVGRDVVSIISDCGEVRSDIKIFELASM